MPELRHLRVLAAVAEAGSFSAAAESLSYTQPAVSRIVAQLERELGAVLVERQARPVRLTDAGQALVRRTEDVFAQLSSARSEIEAITRLDAGTVSLVTFSSAGRTFVVAALSAFRKRYPGVELSIAEGGLPSQMLRALRAGDVDLAVVFDYPSAAEDVGAGLERHQLMDVPFDVVLPCDHRLARRRRVRPRDLSKEGWLLPDFGPESPSLRLILRMCAAAGFEPRVAFRVNDCHLSQALAAAGEGIAVLPRLLLDPLHPGVVARPIEGEVPLMRVSAVRLPIRYLSPPTAAFLELLVESAERWTSNSGLQAVAHTAS
jgi:DNA-binding transcriptional LysR family regulator